MWYSEVESGRERVECGRVSRVGLSKGIVW